MNKLSQKNKLAIQENKTLKYVPISDISFLKADGNYTVICCKDQKHCIAKTLKEYETLLCHIDSPFLRTHKTYIVNTSYIKYVNKGINAFLVLLDDTILEISRRRKQELLEKLAK